MIIWEIYKEKCVYLHQCISTEATILIDSIHPREGATQEIIFRHNKSVIHLLYMQVYDQAHITWSMNRTTDRCKLLYILHLKKKAAVIWLRNCRYGVKHYIINQLKKKYKLKTEIQLVNKNYVCKFAMCCVPTVFIMDILINFKKFYFNVIRVI